MSQSPVPLHRKGRPQSLRQIESLEKEPPNERRQSLRQIEPLERTPPKRQMSLSGFSPLERRTTPKVKERQFSVIVIPPESPHHPDHPHHTLRTPRRGISLAAVSLRRPQQQQHLHGEVLQSSSVTKCEKEDVSAILKQTSNARSPKPFSISLWTKFKYTMRCLTIPTPHPSQPLTSFYQAKVRLSRALSRFFEVACVPRLTASDLTLYRRASQRLLRAYARVLNVISRVFVDGHFPPANRQHRHQYSEELSEELGVFSPHLFFTATILHYGGYIQNKQELSNDLRSHAHSLLRAFYAALDVMVHQALRNPTHYSDTMRDRLSQFDEAYVHFEIHYISLFKPQAMLLSPLKSRHLCLLLNMALCHLLELQAITTDDIDSFSPSLMILLPRYALYLALKKKRDSQCLFVYQSADLDALKDAMKGLSNDENESLNHMILKNEENESDICVNLAVKQRLENGVIVMQNEKVVSLYKLLCKVGDSVHCGMHARQFRETMKNVFQQYNCKDKENYNCDEQLSKARSECINTDEDHCCDSTSLCGESQCRRRDAADEYNDDENEFDDDDGNIFGLVTTSVESLRSVGGSFGATSATERHERCGNKAVNDELHKGIYVDKFVSKSKCHKRRIWVTDNGKDIVWARWRNGRLDFNRCHITIGDIREFTVSHERGCLFVTIEGKRQLKFRVGSIAESWIELLKSHVKTETCN